MANALDDVSSVFTNLKKLTKADPTKYVFAGGDAMIKKDGSAVLVEFNVFPDIAGPMSRLESCLAVEEGAVECSYIWILRPTILLIIT